MMVNYDNIPDELKKLKQWVCCDVNKLPKNPITGGNAMANNPSTWGTFEQALEAKEKFGFAGIGFQFKEPYFGVDLDKCIDDVDFVDEFVDTLGSYTEFSRSGNGIHIICKGKLPDGARRKDKVEMYSNARYFVMTGNIYKEKRPIIDCTETIKILHSKYLSKPTAAALPITVEKVNLDDEELIDRARQSKTGGAFELLYQGQWEGLYASQSEADLAFCNMLAFWTQKNYQQMDRIFRASGLYRKKWDEKRGQLLYSQLTLERAIASCEEVYNPNVPIENIAVRPSNKKLKNTDPEFEYTDTGNGKRFAHYFKENIKYSKNRKKWSFWDGKVWREDTTNEIRRLADECIARMKKQAQSFDGEKKQELLKWAKRTESNKQKTNMIAETEHLRDIAIDVDYFDTQPDLINVENGIVNLRNGELIPHNPDYHMSKIGFSSYAEECEKPRRWLQFLNEITDNNQELIDYLQKAVGYSLTASTREQCLFICYGNGCNGKSTFMDVITTLLGTYALNMQAESIMVKKHSAAVNTDIARLKGARFVTVAEPQEGMKLNESLIKQLTGGDKITARFLFAEEFEFKPEFKMWISTNHKPIISGTDNGIWRRIVLIPFTVKIPQDKIDRNLSYRLRKELPQIMRWAVEGCIKWQQEGLTKQPDCIAQASAEYREEMDVLAKFIEDCIVEGNSYDTIKASELYEVYCEWARSNNEYCHTNTRFGKEFSLRFPGKIKKEDGSHYKECKLTVYAENLREAMKKPDFKRKNNSFNEYYD
ncbi:MAG: hypothetical protein J6T10_02485 [Methanobrevibacter sp.]|nr:hypothetical protein [Methanobrevibacter sp.]